MTDRGKLVRDRIPEIIAANGGSPQVRFLGDEDYVRALTAKLREELLEWEASKDVVELVDLVEVSLALAAWHGVDAEAFEALRQAKRAERGAFDLRLFLNQD
jgi:predicted house-cleaning noncanonical NTP pyrophosphatase (MazG superfamily)